ncbi:MAG: hypothetical protein HY763_05835 [Planctomycetes bacterium]|nr:hypothetical protein [Planctomycetota bacterium]
MNRISVPPPAARGSSRGVLLALAAIALPVVSGCARTLTIHQKDIINTGMEGKRALAERRGEPLEVDIVCVLPGDLKKEQNKALAPDGNITCEDWYKRRPLAGAPDPARFDLPREQIYLLGDERDTSQVVGKRVGKRLCGAKQDRKDKVVINGVNFPSGALFDDRAVIYVFPRFIGENKQVLAEPPAKFHPPGSYRRELFVEIGVDDSAGANKQYVKNITEKKLGPTEKSP